MGGIAVLVVLLDPMGVTHLIRLLAARHWLVLLLAGVGAVTHSYWRRDGSKYRIFVRGDYAAPRWGQEVALLTTAVVVGALASTLLSFRRHRRDRE